MENFNLGDGMLKQMTSIVAALFLFLGSSLQAQLVEPTNMMVMDKYDVGAEGPVFREYFRMLQNRYEGDKSAASAWGIYYESPTVMYRLAAVPEGDWMVCSSCRKIGWRLLMHSLQQNKNYLALLGKVDRQQFGRNWGASTTCQKAGIMRQFLAIHFIR